MVDNGKEVELFFQIDFKYTDEAFFRGQANSPEDAESKLREFLALKGITGIEIIKITQVETLMPEDDETHTIN